MVRSWGYLYDPDRQTELRISVLGKLYILISLFSSHTADSCCLSEEHQDKDSRMALKFLDWGWGGNVSDIIWLYSPRLCVLTLNLFCEALRVWKHHLDMVFRDETSGNWLGLDKVIRIDPSWVNCLGFIRRHTDINRQRSLSLPWNAALGLCQHQMWAFKVLECWAVWTSSLYKVCMSQVFHDSNGKLNNRSLG